MLPMQDQERSVSFSCSGNAAARGLGREVRGTHQGQGVVRMVAFENLSWWHYR